MNTPKPFDPRTDDPLPLEASGTLAISVDGHPAVAVEFSLAIDAAGNWTVTVEPDGGNESVDFIGDPSQPLQLFLPELEELVIRHLREHAENDEAA